MSTIERGQLSSRGATRAHKDSSAARLLRGALGGERGRILEPFMCL